MNIDTMKIVPGKYKKVSRIKQAPKWKIQDSVKCSAPQFFPRRNVSTKDDLEN